MFFFHLRNIARLRGMLSKQNAERLVHAFISSRIDYCNSLFAGISNNVISRLQLVQNAAARVLRVAHPVKALRAECRMCSIVWRSQVRIQAMSQPTVTGSS